jgi:hypothetical protein
MLETEFGNLTNKQIYGIGIKDGMAMLLKSFVNMEIFTEEEINMLIDTLEQNSELTKGLKVHYETIED